MSAKVSRESTNNSSASQPVIAVRKVTAEGYVNLRVGGAAAKAANSRGSQKIGGKESLLSKKQAPQKYVKLDGYVMRVFAKEPVGAYTEDQMPAEQILDLRHVENLSCADKFELRPEKGTLVLKAKAEKYLFSTKRKEFTIEPADMMVGEAEPWWLRHVASALPDRAVSNSLRAWKDQTLCFALMKGHADQPSAYKRSDREWRNAVAAQKKAAAKLASASDRASSRKSGRKISNEGNGLAARLDKAAKSRGGGSFKAGDDDSYISAVDAPSTKKANRASQPPPDEEGRPSEARISVDDEAPRDAPTPSVGGGAPPTNSKLPTAAEAEAAERVRAASVEETEPTEWWFIKGSTGAIMGPYTNADMRRKYRNGGVHETTLVRFLPLETSPPTVEAQSDAEFAVLREMCSASGPPFMN